MEALDGAGQPDESLETLDVSAAVVHQLVFGHSSAAAGGWDGGRRKCLLDVCSLNSGPLLPRREQTSYTVRNISEME